jgi:hypothetical protein
VIAGRRLGDWGLGQRRDTLEVREFKEMPLSGGLDDALAPRAKDVSAKQLDLAAQLVDGLFVLFARFIVQLGCLIEGSLEILVVLIELLNLLSKPVQQAVTFAWISRPWLWGNHGVDYSAIIGSYKATLINF